MDLASALKRVDVVIGQRDAHSSGKSKAKRHIKALEAEVAELEARKPEPLPKSCPNTPEVEARLAAKYTTSARKRRYILVASSVMDVLTARAESKTEGLTEKAKIALTVYVPPPAAPQQPQYAPVPQQPQYAPAPA